jgi:hypothetical protein
MSKSNSSRGELRNECCTTKVTHEQKLHIQHLARQCGMSVSDYLLARAYNYEPKSRLTPAQSEVYKELVKNRSNITKFMSILKGMDANKRIEMFRRESWIKDALKLLDTTSKGILEIIKRYFSPNPVPGRTSNEPNSESES